MGVKLSTNEKSEFKKTRSAPHRIRVPTNNILKRHSHTPPMSPQGTNSVQSDTSTGSTTKSFNYIDNTQEGESDRNHVKHFALKVLFEGNLLESITDNLDFTSDKLRVLDIGCGSGTWLLDMATENPNVQFIGVDQIALHPQAIRPSNVNFSVQDVLEGLSYEDNSFDLVQMRLFSMTFDRTYWIQALAEVYRVLKPGGYLQLMEGQYVDEGDDLIIEYGKKVASILESNDQDPYICHNLTPLLKDNGFTPVEFVTKAVPLETHPLRTEILYVIRLTLDSCKPYLFKICDINSEKEYLDFRTEYLDHRVSSSESVWTAAVGMKPLK